MSLLLDIIVQTLRTLWAHKLRSFLTMFGIAWGVGSLLLLIGVGEGFRSGNRKQMATIGEDVMFSFWGNIPPAQGSTTGMRRYPITYRDYLDVKNEVRSVRLVVPAITRNDIRAVSQYQNSNGNVAGVVPEFAKARYMPIGFGRWFNDGDEAQKHHVVVIGSDMRKNLFADLDRPPLGETILLNGMEFTVIGVLDAIGQNENNPNNSRIYMPFSVMAEYFPLKGENLPTDTISNLVYQPVTRERHYEARDDVRKILARNHQFDYHLTQAFEDWDTIRSAEMMGKIFDAMDMFLGGVGIVTLMLGGIGIVNIMLVSVTERTAEIGVMKAMGATNGNVLTQVFLEGVFLTMVSGGLGIGGAALLMHAVGGFKMPPGFDTPKLVPWSAALSVALLSLAAIAGGLYPARKAALLEPVEAMRRE